MDEQLLSAIVNAGGSAVVAYAFLRGLRTAESVLFRLLATVERLCNTPGSPCGGTPEDASVKAAQRPEGV